MPPFGLAHKLLSGRHPDTSPPAGGADPDDGQVPTWSDALGAWIAADPAGGVTDHGALTGLVPDDDHTQYALADKSRPSPWVAAADLTPRSLADLGTKAHDLLAGLTDDDHSIYALLAGRSGGQTFVGGTGSGDKLGLTCRSGAVAGLLELQETSPQLALTGDLDVSGHIAAGGAAAFDAGRIVNAQATIDAQITQGVYSNITNSRASGAGLAMGVAGGASVQGTPLLGYAYGLYFFARHATASACYTVNPIYIAMQSGVVGTGALSFATGLLVAAATWAGSKPATSKGVDILDQGGAGVGTAYGLRILDQAATTTRLLELGPAVPYMRLGGGANPAANTSHLSLKFGATLKLLTEYDADSAGEGYRAVRVPN